MALANSGQLRRPVPALAPMLFQYADVGHHHAAIDRLAHVIDGEQPDLHGGERLHLDPGLADGFDLCPAVHMLATASKKTILVPRVGQIWDRNNLQGEVYWSVVKQAMSMHLPLTGPGDFIFTALAIVTVEVK